MELDEQPIKRIKSWQRGHNADVQIQVEGEAILQYPKPHPFESDTLNVNMLPQLSWCKGFNVNFIL